MTLRFGCRSAAIHVTLVADAGAAVVVKPGTADESGGGVAGRAIQAGAQVRWVGLRIHTDGRYTIVAGGAVVDDTGVIEGRRKETAGVVAGTAILVCQYMVERFSGGENAIVTGYAVIHDASMVEGSRDEAGGQVTLAAVPGGGNMIWRRHFTRCGDTVMARGAVVGNACVIEPRTRKGHSVMAQGAILCRAQMKHRLNGCDGTGSVVAG